MGIKEKHRGSEGLITADLIGTFGPCTVPEIKWSSSRRGRYTGSCILEYPTREGTKGLLLRTIGVLGANKGPELSELGNRSWAGTELF